LWPKPAPTPQKIVLDPNQPESYLGLLNVNPNSLPEDQRKIERALYDGLVALGSASTPAHEAETKLGTELFTPLAAANIEADLQAIRQVAEKLRSAGIRPGFRTANPPTKNTETMRSNKAPSPRKFQILPPFRVPGR
jgi:hypothetical protein